MSWPVRLHVEFESEFAEFAELPESVQEKILALMALLVEYGPWLGRPHAGTLNGSKHSNMKELRLNAADGVWRVTYAFDPRREAILLLAGDKSGGSEDRFYKRLIAKSDARYGAHLARLREK